MRERRCHNCNAAFLSFFPFYDHKKECGKEDLGFPHVCQACKRKFHFLSLFHKHQLTCLKLHSINKQNRKKMVKVVEQKKNLKMHEISDETSDSSLSEPVKVKEPSYSITCNICDDTFWSASEYKRHLKRKGACQPKSHVCEICNRHFSTAFNLSRHKSHSKSCKALAKTLAEKKEKRFSKYRIESPMNEYKKEKREKCFNKYRMESPVSEYKNEKRENRFSKYRVESPVSEYKNEKREKRFSKYRVESPVNEYKKKTQKKIPSSYFYVPEPKYICKCCDNTYTTADLFKNHLKKNSLCSKIHYYKIKTQYEMGRKTGINQTARKSFSNLRKTMEYSKRLTQHAKKKNISDWETKKRTEFLNNLHKSPNISMGSARKSFRCSETSKNKSDQKHVCKVCKKNFETYSELQIHKEEHISKKKPTYESKCPECYEVFHDSFLFFEHQKKLNHWGKATKSASTSTVKCPFCGKEFIHVRSRNAHLRNHADRPKEEIMQFLKKTTCKVCSQIFVTEAVKIQHSKIEHPERTKIITESSDSDTKKQDQSDSDEPKQEQPQEPQESQEPQEVLASHKYVGYSNKIKVMVTVTPSIKKQLKENPTVCPVCFKKYSTQFIRNRHFRMHTLESAFECQFCPTKFARSDNLMKHMQQEHNDYMAFECSACNSRFMTKMRALQHGTKVHPHTPAKLLIKERNVSVIPPNKNKSFKPSNSSKTQSIVSYGNEVIIPNEEFYCDVCEISFLKLCGLQRHRQSKLHRDILEKSRAAILEKKKAALDENLASTSQTSVSTSNSPSSQPKPELTVSFQPKPIPLLPSPSQSDPVSTPTHFPENSSKILQCSVCTQKFATVNEFVPHRLSHFSVQNCNSEISELNPYICEICAKTMDNHQKVQLHLFWHLQYMQSQTGSKTTPQKSPSENIPVAIPENLSGHQVAKKSFNRREKQQELVIDGVKKPLFTCSACNIGFTTKHHYTLHVRQNCRARKNSPADSEIGIEQTSSNDSCTSFMHKKFTCLQCSQEFTSIAEHETHTKNCKKIIFHYCEKCSFLFINNDLFKQHRVSFCNDNSSLLSVTVVDTKKKDLLKSTIISESAIAGCIPCIKTFNSLQSCAQHITVHLNKTNDSLQDTSMSDEKSAVDLTEDMITIDESAPALFEDDLSNEEMSYSENISTEPSTLHESALKAVNAENPVFESSAENSNIDESCTKAENEVLPYSSKETDNAEEDSEEMEQSVLATENDVSDVLPEDNEMMVIEQDENEPDDAIEKLRHNFSRLLCVLISDPELMQQLGYGQLTIDDVLINVLEQMGHPPAKNDGSTSDLERLRQNIRLLLDVCIKDQVMDLIADGKTSTDSVVIEALKIFGVDVDQQ